MPAKSSKRILWIDVLRTLCALQIVGFHWLRATTKAGLLGPQNSENFVSQWRLITWGIQGFRFILIGHNQNPVVRVLNDGLGLLFEFGFEALWLFVLLSGFSLGMALNKRPSNPPWGSWIYRRIERILIPYYVVALPLVIVMLTLSQFGGTGVLGQFSGKLAQNGADGSIVWIVLSHIFLIDPRHVLFIPEFLVPAWWFVPAILVGYFVVPMIWTSLKKWGTVPVLTVAFCISVLTGIAVIHQRATEVSWTFVAFNEAFNFSLGIALGRAYATPAGAVQIDRYLTTWKGFLIGLFFVAVGTTCNMYLATYPISSSIFTIGAAICGGQVAVRLSRYRIGHWLSKIDSYAMYLIHQPFGFVIVTILIRLHMPLIPTLGAFVYFGVVLSLTRVISIVVASVERVVFRSNAAKPLPVA